MYQLSVPIVLRNLDKYGVEQYIDILKKIGTDIVFLSIGCYQTDKTKQEKTLQQLKKYIPQFKAQGFLVGVWLWTFQVEGENDFLHITAPDGKVSEAQACPSDQGFVNFALNFIENVAKCDPDIILFDDDFRYGFIDCGLGCTCQNHRKKIGELVGAPMPEGDISSLLFSGEGNPWRTGYLKANGYFFRAFAQAVRERVDSIHPQIRVGLCACMTTWDFDGVSAAELSKILAGKTKPFLRLIGAPYWASTNAWGNNLSDIIELERMESAWCDPDIDIFAEGDTYPRPRFACSAAALEGFDMALRASGATNGIHKYTLDYWSDTAYESFYNRKHLQNQPIYQAIDTHFAGKTPAGVRVYEAMQKFEHMEVPRCFAGRTDVQELFFSPASRLLAAQSIPTTYEGLGRVGIAFGENAKFLPKEAFCGGLILDITAAAILEKSGVDVGLASLGDEYAASYEICQITGQRINLKGCPVREVTVKDGVTIFSYFGREERKTVGTYAYKNSQGQNFLVFCFEGYEINEHAYKQYLRGEQIYAWLENIGQRLPAKMHRNPECYLLCKEDKDGLAVWIGNFFPDECDNTAVALDGVFDTLTCINCEGVLEGNVVKLKEIPPYASVGFCVGKKKKPC